MYDYPKESAKSRSSRFYSVPMAIVLHLVYLHLDYTGPTRGDLSLGYWRSAVCEQSVQSLAIVTSSLPYAKMFMQGLDSGMLRIDDTRRRGEDYSKGSAAGMAYELLDISSDGTKQQQSAKRHNTDSGRARNTGISQTKTWTVERGLATEGELSPGDNLGLAISKI
jgi:hypothetical protein